MQYESSRTRRQEHCITEADIDKFCQGKKKHCIAQSRNRISNSQNGRENRSIRTEIKRGPRREPASRVRNPRYGRRHRQSLAFRVSLPFQCPSSSVASREEGATFEHLMFARVQFDPKVLSERSRVLWSQRIGHEVPESAKKGHGVQKR